MNRTEKEALVLQMQDVFNSASLVVLTHYSGLTVSESSDLRTKMREAGAGYRVTKNRVVKRALEGTQFTGLDAHFTGPTGMAWSQDPIMAAKIVHEYSKTNDKLKITAACLDGKLLSPEEVIALATLPSLDELRGKIVGVLQAPLGKVVSITGAPAAGLARVIKAYSEKAA